MLLRLKIVSILNMAVKLEYSSLQGFTLEMPFDRGLPHLSAVSFPYISGDQVNAAQLDGNESY